MKTTSFNKAGLIALAFGCLLMFSCQTTVLTGQTVKEPRNVPSFDGVALAFSGDIFITQGSPQKVVIEAEKSTLEIIETEVEGSILVLKIKRGHWGNLGEINAYITLPDISHLSVSGSGDMICETTVKTQEIKLEVSGSGSIRVSNLEANEINAVVTGSGDISVTGTGIDQNELDATITGSGSIKASEMPVGEASVTITGSGSATVNVLKELETNITGSGNVLYKGNPLVNATATGSGKTKSLK